MGTKLKPTRAIALTLGSMAASTKRTAEKQ
jgi:hypothetical protein